MKSHLVKFICKECHQEVEAEIYKSMNVVGDYAECPRCEAENEIEEEVIDDRELDTFNDWEEKEEDALAKT